MNTALITLITGFFFGAVKAFFWFRGRDDAKKDIELEQTKEALEEVEKKRKRDAIVDANPSIRERLHDIYSANKD